MFGPSQFCPVLWPLLTSYGSLLLRIHFFQMRPQDLPGYSHALSLFTCRIYRKRFRAVIGLCFVMQTHPRLRPYMRFLFVRPEVCPLGDLLTPKIRLSSDSASRRTPLPLANPSHCRADSGLSPYRTCAHRAHMERTRAEVPEFFPLCVVNTEVPSGTSVFQIFRENKFSRCQLLPI